MAESNRITQLAIELVSSGSLRFSFRASKALRDTLYVQIETEASLDSNGVLQATVLLSSEKFDFESDELSHGI